MKQKAAPTKKNKINPRSLCEENKITKKCDERKCETGEAFSHHPHASC